MTTIDSLTDLGSMKHETVHTVQEDATDPKDPKITTFDSDLNASYLKLDGEELEQIGGYTTSSETGQGPYACTIPFYNANGSMAGKIMETLDPKHGWQVDLSVQLDTTQDGQVLLKRDQRDGRLYTLQNLFTPNGVYYGTWGRVLPTNGLDDEHDHGSGSCGRI